MGKASRRKRQLRRRLETMGRKLQTTVPIYESNLLWGSVGIGAGIVLAVIAAMVKDFRWLLIIAWPFFCLAIWAVLRTVPSHKTRYLVLSLGSIFVAGGLYMLNRSLKPDTQAPPERPKFPSASEIAAELEKRSISKPPEENVQPKERLTSKTIPKDKTETPSPPASRALLQVTHYDIPRGGLPFTAKQQQLNIFMKHFGRIPGKNLRVYADIVQASESPKGEGEAWQRIEDKIRTSPLEKKKDGMDVGIGAELHFTVTGKELTDKQWQMVQNGVRPLYIVAALKYADEAGERTTEFCIFHWSDKPIFIYCYEHNTIR